MQLTPIHFAVVDACSNGNYGTLSMLIEAGADVDARGPSCISPIDIALAGNS